MTDRFHLLGAYDRFNYGDVLFAHLSEAQVQARFPGAPVTHYATHASDLRREGGVVTHRLGDLVRNIRAHPADTHVILITGGEVLSSPWALMAEHGAGPRLARFYQRGRKYLGEPFMNRLFRAASGTPWDLPWLPDPDSFPGIRVEVFYNSVGGGAVGRTGEEAANWQRRALAKAGWLSVRDDQSADRVADLGLPRPPVSPDSAVTMAALPQAAMLADLRPVIAPRMAQGALPDAPYICVQCGTNYFLGQEQLLADQVRAVHEATGMPVVSFAIGRAAGHNDHLVARRLQDLLGAPAWYSRAPEDLTVWEIMSLIAGSGLYMGTSLHGFITAFSFGRPHVGLDPRVIKITGFRDAWDLPETPAGTPFAQMVEAAVAALALPAQARAAKAEAAAARYRADNAAMWAKLTA